MTRLKLTAGCEGRNERHALIGVFQNGGKAGTLIVEAEHEQAVLGAINAHADLLEACKACIPLIANGSLAGDLLRAAIAKARGENT